MALQLILGNSGAGKSSYIYEKVIRESMEHPERDYLILVPDQFTMQTQKALAQMHPGRGLLNVDVLGFERLAYRVFEEVGGDTRQLLEETGKGLVLQKVVQRTSGGLRYLGSRMKKQGYIQEMKSLLSELMQYQVEPEDLEALKERAQKENSLLYYKLSDVELLYEEFRNYLEDRYMTGEEVLDRLCQVIGQSKLVQGSTVVLDGYTGFTPVQNQVIRKLLSLCDMVYAVVTLAEGEYPYQREESHKLFSMSKQTIHSLCSLAAETGTEIQEEIWCRPKDNWRFEESLALDFLEKHLFRYPCRVFEGEQQEIQIYAAPSPLREMEEAAVRIARLVRTEGCRYGEIAVITGDLEIYGNYARQVFEKADIPYFIDEKHSVLMNPFVEYLRASVEVYVQNCSYESMFRYLRGQMTGLTPDEVDLLENYVIALGIRGKNRWQETWVRVYRGMKPEDILQINELRSRVMEGLFPLLEGWQGRNKTVESMTRALYEFVVRNDTQRKLKIREEGFKKAGNLAMEKEYAQIYGIVMELFDKLVDILGDEPMTLVEYQQLLEAGLAQMQVGLVPPSTDQVLVGDMERTRLKDIKALFFVGMNDGCIPKDTTVGGILTEADRRFLEENQVELAPGPREQAGIQRFYLYLNLTKPSRHLTLSYSHSSAAGEIQNPAYLIGTIRKLFPGIAVYETQSREQALDLLERPGTSLEFFLAGLEKAARLGEGRPEPVWSELYRWYLQNDEYRPIVQRLTGAAFFQNPGDRISESVAKALYGQVSPYGATRLEKFAACAFAHFIQYGLRLHERAVYEFQAMDMGNLMHGALENFSQELQKQKLDWAALTEEERVRLGEEALERAAEDYGNTVLESSARNQYMKKRVGRLFQRTLWALQEQLRRGKFVPEGFEVSLGGGRIDRLDVCEHEGTVYVKIVDYKTGNTAFHLVELYHGLQLQLAVYLDGAMEAERKKHPEQAVKPAGIFYYNTKDPMLTVQMKKDLEGVEKKLLGALQMNGVVLNDTQVAQLLDATGETIPVRYKKDGSFYSNSSVITEEQFALLEEFSKKKIQKIQEEILGGEAQAAPYQMKDRQACTYCPYHGICGFDQKIPGYAYRNLKDMEKEEIWDAMEKEV
ncbi:MAG: helicase-exonuclease AddAB subunit AddB [Blautia sp.]|jgi:ATP-dependent helicase/nuclease subunit B